MTVNLRGTLNQDPEICTTPSRRPYLRAMLAGQVIIIWHPATTPGASTLHQGSEIRVRGRIQSFDVVEAGTTQTIERFIVDHLEVLTVTLTGYLGNDPQYRLTREEIITRSYENPVAQCDDQVEVRIGNRLYLRHSLAVHPEGPGGPTEWHQLLFWDGGALKNQAARLAGRGDEVRITGRPTTHTFNDDEGHQRTVERIIVDDLQILQLKTRHAA